jgi:hypothetical protein
MQATKHLAVQTLKWSAMAGSFSVLLFGGLIAISWLLFQFLVHLVGYLP